MVLYNYDTNAQQEQKEEKDQNYLKPPKHYTKKLQNTIQKSRCNRNKTSFTKTG